jgi:methionyl-tRNA formyltransferase
MRLFVMGQAAFGQDVFNRLREAGEEVVAVAAPARSMSGRADRLRAAADAAGVPAFEIRGLREPAALEQLRSLRPELGVMAYVSDIISLDVLHLPERGTIQYHPSLLPRHRGRSAINWAIIQGDRMTGVTIFWPDEGIDTGPVLLQREVPIGPDDTTGTLYYEKLYPLGLDMFVEAVRLVKEGRAPRIPQDERSATYEKPCDDRVARIDWRRPAREVYDLIRGCDPSPGAWTRADGTMVRVLDARLRPPVTQAPGVIVSVSEEGLLIAGVEGSILARKLAPESGSPAPAREFAIATGMEPGLRFLNAKRG